MKSYRCFSALSLRALAILSAFATFVSLDLRAGDGLSGDQRASVSALHREIVNLLGTTRLELERRLGKPSVSAALAEGNDESEVPKLTQYSKWFVFAESNLNFEFTAEFGVYYRGDMVTAITLMLPVRGNDNWIVDGSGTHLKRGDPRMAANIMVAELRIVRDTIANERVR